MSASSSGGLPEILKRFIKMSRPDKNRGKEIPKYQVRFRQLAFWLIFGCLVCSVNGQELSSESYRLGPGDIIDVVVVRNETLSRSGVRVDNDGFIQMPMLDENIVAACHTESELADAVKQLYKRYLLKPSVYVHLKEVNSQPVALIGAVNSPGRFQLQRAVRLLELLSFANGPNARAGRTVQIIHNPNNRVCRDKSFVQNQAAVEEVVFLPLKETLAGGERANPYVLKGDIIRVIEADQVYVIGNVRNAVTVNLVEPVTLTQALAEAGGVLPNSNTEKIKILRQEGQNRREIVVNLKNVKKKTEDDIVLQPNDIVEVPGESGGKKLLKDIIKTIITNAATLPIRRIL